MFFRGLTEKRQEGVYTLEEIASRVGPVAEAYGVERICVFGSYAKGEAGPDSDIDLLVSPGNAKGMAIGGLYRELQKALGKAVDLVTDRGDPDFVKMISKNMVLVYEA